MIDRLTVRNHAIMTTGTATEYLEVVHLCCRYERNSAVTVFADFTGADVIKAFSNRDAAIVATGTIHGRGVMIEISRHPCSGRVAIFASFRACNVFGIFAAGGDPIVATRTTAYDLEVINKYRR